MHWSLLSQLNPLGVFVFVVYFHLISYHDVSGLSNSHVWFHFCGSRIQLSYFGATHKAGSGGLIWKLGWGKITFKITQVIVRMLFLMGGWTKGPPQSAGCCQRPLSVPCHTGLSNKSIYLSQPWRPRRQIQSAYKTEVAISCNPVISMTSHHLSHCSIDQEWVTKVQTTQDGVVGGGWDDYKRMWVSSGSTLEATYHRAGEWERSESEPTVISTFLTDPWKNYGVLSQDHKCKDLYQDHRRGTQNHGHLWNWLSPFAENPPIITSRLSAPNLDKNAYLSAHPLVS